MNIDPILQYGFLDVLSIYVYPCIRKIKEKIAANR